MYYRISESRNTRVLKKRERACPEFFLNCLGTLLIIKISELNSKNNYLSFNLICMIISVASLIKGQGIISTLISFLIIILLVINMYLTQQKEVLDYSFKNIIKYLGFGLSIFPFIIIFYLIFPRAEFSFKLFNNSTSSLGIPDNINLGQDEQKLYTLIWNRTVSSQMSNSQHERKKIEVCSKDQKYVFNASSRKTLFEGFENLQQCSIFRKK